MKALWLAAAFAAGTTLSAAERPDELRDKLTTIEKHFFEGWQQKSLKPFEDQIAPDGVAYGEYGLFDKATQLKLQQGAEANCEVKSFEFTDVKVVPVTKDTAFLFYKADQNALCGGQPVPTPMNCSSLYVKRNGHWLNVYRSGSPAKTLPK